MKGKLCYCCILDLGAKTVLYYKSTKYKKPNLP